MSERADLPDVPEAAVEAGADQLAKRRFKKIGKGEPWRQRFIDANDRIGIARTVLVAALPKLVEQGWTPPDTETDR